jgi:hypothetical protein
MRILSLLILFLGYLPVSAVGQDEFLPDKSIESPINAQDVTSLFTGQIHRGSYNFSMQNFAGYHFEEITSADGTVLHKMGNRIDKGTWEQTDNQICFDYEATDLLGACFTFYQRGNCIYHHQETVEGQVAPRFTAVSVLKGETPSCEPPMA